MSACAKITPAQMAWVLSRLFKVRAADKPFDVARAVNESNVFYLPFALENCRFCDLRMPVVSGVSTANKDFMAYVRDYVDDSESGFAVISDTCRSGTASLFVVTIDTKDEVRHRLDKLVRHMDRINSLRLVIQGERPNLAAAAVQLLSLINQ